MPNNLMYCGTFKGRKVFIEGDTEIDEFNPVIQLKEVLYKLFEEEAKEYLLTTLP